MEELNDFIRKNNVSNNEDLITDSYLTKNKKILCFGIGHYENIKIGGYRYSLEITIENNGNDELYAIMLNPSKTFPGKESKGFDNTIRNVIRMAYAKGYTKLIIFNSFPYIEPKSDIAKKYKENKQVENKEEIKNKTKAGKRILIAWGTKINPKIGQDYLTLFKKLELKPVAFEWNVNSNCPYHPSLSNDNLLTKDETGVRKKKKNKKEEGIISQFINSDRDFINLKIIGNKLTL